MADDVNAFIDRFTLDGVGDGPLSGRTFGAKDLFDIAGRVTGYGNPAWAASREPAYTTASAVRRLLDAGATCLGKTHTDELAYSLMGVNAHHGTPLNSADPRRVPGGSSSGSAAAVAAGLVDIGLGSDTGGSVRMPASFCGLWGIRTTFGAVPLDGAMPFTASFDTVGWLTRSGPLLAEVLRVHGFASGAPRRLVLPVDLWAEAEADCVAALGPAMAALQAHLGPAMPVILAPEGLAHWRETFRVCQAGEIWQALGDWVSTHDPQFGPGTRERFEMAASITPEAFEAAQGEKSRIAGWLESIIDPETVVVLPTAPAPAPLREADPAALDGFRLRAQALLCAAGLGGLPQLSIPAGAVEGGPVGISLMGAGGADLALVELACDAGLGALSA
ncbi:amidase [Roseivivax lentus]|uniref:Amidase n=1 Tax=Roseivivax lentus TaxID=633194 RepID=A0A1N7KBR3_9RHOB|nr:amidase [Roseivivax lentus]SIS58950.1 amidase [Roseivivax lentus]